MGTIIFLVILFSMMFIKLIIQGVYLIHRFQQLGYYNLKFMEWLRSNQYRPVLLWGIFELLLPLLIILVLYFSIKELPLYKYITSGIMIFIFSWKIIHPFLSKWVSFKSNAKVPLVLTARVKRLFAVFFLVCIMTLIFIFNFAATPFDEFTLNKWDFFQLNAFILLISIISPILMIASNIIIYPLEASIRLKYFLLAKFKLKKSKLKKIGITGSYGKTSTKFFLSAILNQKHKTLHTPASFNTPMGISKVINTTNLKEYEMFIIEMGADKKGDIKELCSLAKPDYAILTAIDIQHLETFGTVENIIETKLSIFKFVNPKGIGIYNFDSVLLRENIAKRVINLKLMSYSINENNIDKTDIIAKNIKHTREGLEFTSVFKDKTSLNIKTELLGSHNVSNILACILMAKHLGLTDDEIHAGINKIQPVEHRLQRINSASGILVLDDAFNSNLKGAFEALKVLKEIEGNKKIIVTPGLIGLGEKQSESNKQLGNLINDYADVAILVGKEKTKNIFEGLIEKGFNRKNIHIASSLNEAKDFLKNILVRNDVVLFENDLPDVLNE